MSPLKTIVRKLLTISDLTHSFVTPWQRQTSVKLFQGLLAKFDESGRYRYYRSLFCQVSHSGVKGLLVHAVKNEVDDALKEVRVLGVNQYHLFLLMHTLVRGCHGEVQQVSGARLATSSRAGGESGGGSGATEGI